MPRDWVASSASQRYNSAFRHASGYTASCGGRRRLSALHQATDMPWPAPATRSSTLRRSGRLRVPAASTPIPPLPPMARNNTARERRRSSSATPASGKSWLAWRVMNRCQMQPTHSSGSKAKTASSYVLKNARAAAPAKQDGPLRCSGPSGCGQAASGLGRQGWLPCPAPLAEAEQVADQADQEEHAGPEPQPEEQGQLLHGVHEA